MYSMTVSHHFLMAHTLTGALFGAAQRLHGATLVVEAEFRRAELDEHGVICDFTAALDLVKEVVAPFDCRNLDELPEFRGKNTTSEFLAGEIHQRLARRIRDGALGSGTDGTITSLKVTLRESPIAWAAYEAPLA
jgi:6-pyruvoyl-tetrahydropterin synthase